MSAPRPFEPREVPPIVRLHHGARVAHRLIAGADELGVAIVDHASQRPIGVLNMREAARWLGRHGYRWSLAAGTLDQPVLWSRT